MMRFALTTSEHEGFKVSTSAENEKELAVVRELTKLLIEKIEKIKVIIGYEEENSVE